MKLIRKLFSCIVFAILIYSGLKLIEIAGIYQSGKETYTDLQQKAFAINESIQDLPNTDSLARNMKEINPDYIAWINIKGSSINYPIVEESTEVDYLTHNFKKNEDFYGCLFICQANPFADGNTIIYGHNMKNGEMFGSLKKYLDQSYFNSHREINIQFENQTLNYYVFSVRIEEVEGSAYTYNISPEYISEMKEASLVSSADSANPEPENETNIITLSTCYQTSNRLLIQAYKRKDNS